MQDTIFFIRTDLLLEEETFDILKQTISKLDSPPLYEWGSIDYISGEKISLTLGHELNDKGISRFIHSGYILLNLEQLKKLLSL